MKREAPNQFKQPGSWGESGAAQPAVAYNTGSVSRS